MDFDQFQQQARTSADYPNLGSNLLYPALGLAGESGETVDKIKKLWRNQGITNGKALSHPEYIGLVKELGDVLWYVAALASELGIPLSEVAHLNLQKLADRKERNVIKSAGDDR